MPAERSKTPSRLGRAGTLRRRGGDGPCWSEQRWVAPPGDRWRRALPWASAGASAVALALVLLFGELRSKTWFRRRQCHARGVGRRSDARDRRSWGPPPVTERTGVGLRCTTTHRPRVGLFVGSTSWTPHRCRARGRAQPVFLTDGQWIAFFADAKLKKVALSGGAPVTFCDTPDGRGGGGLATDSTCTAVLRWHRPRRPAARLVERRDPDAGHQSRGRRGRTWVAAGLARKRCAALCRSQQPHDWDDATLVVQRLPAGERKIVQRGGSYGRYLASGHIVYLHDAKVFAVPFDSRAARGDGPPFLALDGVGSNPNGGSRSSRRLRPARLSISTAPSAQSPWAARRFNGWNRAGRRTLLRATRRIGQPSLLARRHAPRRRDQRREATRRLGVRVGARQGIQLTLNAAQNQKPVWTPVGRRFVFWSNRDVQQNLYWQRADGTGDAQRLTNSQHPQSAASWHPGGRILAFQETRPQTGADLMVVAIEGDELTGWKPGTPTSFLSTAALEREPMFSPDGKWLAYQANDLGPFEVYVRPFPGPGGTWRISTAGGITTHVVAYAPRTHLPQPENQLMVRRLHRSRRFIPRREAATVGGGLHRTAEGNARSTCTLRRERCRRPRARLVRPATGSTRLHSQLLRRAAADGACGER